MLIIEDLKKTYGKVTAVAGLSLAIRRGEFFGLLGPNGAGKSTTVRMLSTLTPPSSGSVSIAGRRLDRNLTDIKRTIGVVPQHNNLDGEMTAWENLELHGRLFGLGKEERRGRIKELLIFTELEERAHDLVRTFSGGMKRKLMIARALMHRPVVLLLDEPTVGLDPAVRRKMWDLLKTLKAEGLTVLLTTHYIEEAEILCDRVALMHEGVLIELDTPLNLIAKSGTIVLEYFTQGVTMSEFFATREEALSRAASLEGSVNIRPANLEDVFIRLTKRRVSE